MEKNSNREIPLVSVNMPVYNGEKFIRYAIDSILNQTYQNFELIIVNDGSTDQSVNIINTYTDKRIKLFHNEKNYGLVYTHNKAIKLSQGKYIAMLDCDDIAYPSRLEKQVSFLERHPDYMLVGSCYEPIDTDNRINGDIFKYILPDYLIESELFFRNYFAHPAVMLPKVIFNEFSYIEGSFPAEDYLLWSQIAYTHPVHNLQEVLLKYRKHNDSITIIKREEQEACGKRILGFQLAKLGLTQITDEQLEMYFDITRNKIRKNKKDKEFKGLLLIDLLKKQNAQKKIFDRLYFNLRLEYCKDYFNRGISLGYIFAALKFILYFTHSMKINKSKMIFIYRITKIYFKQTMKSKHPV